ncbi:MAG: hypothetical protein KC478_17180 [Bacteriovoracaceae bacterium]|nr:hypothetical protein [Bacteriovoracaceae bacterium]
MSVVSPDPKFEIAQRKFGQVHASKEAKKMFLDKAFLKFDFPPGFSFVEMPSERDDMIILHGRDDKNLAEFSIFASEYVPTEGELFEFLSEKSTVPTIGDGLQEIKKIRTVQSNEGSGLKQISIYQSRNSNFVNTYVAWVPRRDNAGNYLFLLSADQKYIDKTEDYFDGIKDRMKALDVP